MTTDIDSLVQRSARLQVDDIDFEIFGHRPLDAATLRCLRYMHDVEGHTACYLRDLLATRAHRDARITGFLACWCYEEHWHGEAIGAVLRAHGQPAGTERLSALRHRLPRRDALRPLAFTVASGVTRHIVPVHMTWGALNERSTQAGYARLAAKADHPVLTELLRRIMRQEGRHIDFYTAVADRLLCDSRAARRLTRWAVSRYWAPVGSGVMPRTELRFLVHHLFGDQEGHAAARRIDRQVGRLPGLGGLHLVEEAVAAVAPTRLGREGPGGVRTPDGALAPAITPDHNHASMKEHRHAC